jgi:hypothetical protein
MKRPFALFAALALGTDGTALGQTTYTWSGTETDFQLSTAWTPNRVAPAADDILVFDGGTAPNLSVSNLPASQTIGGLRVINSANTIFAAPPASSTITIAGTAAPA